jgi:hypothetical protein
MKDKNFRNMVDDPYLYRDCCGGSMIGADGSINTIIKETKAITVATALLMVGLVVVIGYAYSKAIK